MGGEDNLDRKTSLEVEIASTTVAASIDFDILLFEVSAEVFGSFLSSFFLSDATWSELNAFPDHRYFPNVTDVIDESTNLNHKIVM